MENKHRFDNRSKTDMRDLSMAVWALSPKQFYAIAPAILAGDLMRTHWWIRFTIWIMQKRRKIGRVEAYRVLRNEILKKHKIDLFYQLQLSTALHITRGKDQYDKKSAGGFNAREVDLMVELLVVAMEVPPQ